MVRSCSSARSSSGFVMVGVPFWLCRKPCCPLLYHTSCGVGARRRPFFLPVARGLGRGVHVDLTPELPPGVGEGHATHTCPRSRASPRSLVQSNNSSTARSSGTIAANTTHNPCQSGEEPRAALMWV